LAVVTHLGQLPDELSTQFPSATLEGSLACATARQREDLLLVRLHQLQSVVTVPTCGVRVALKFLTGVALCLLQILLGVRQVIGLVGSLSTVLRQFSADLSSAQIITVLDGHAQLVLENLPVSSQRLKISTQFLDGLASVPDSESGLQRIVTHTLQ